MQTFQDFLANQNAQISLLEVVFNLTLAAVLSLVLSYVYINYGKTLSNRRLFAKNFIQIAMTTMLIITIVKSSLALSLGLVGALSIVRFRAAIKEPEELSYLFLCIAVGLGLGANQQKVTLVAFAFIITTLVVKSYWEHAEGNKNLNLMISSHNPNKVELDQIIEVLQRHCSVVNLKRFDDTKELTEALFAVEFDNFDVIKRCKEELRQLKDSLKITFMDNKVTV